MVRQLQEAMVRIVVSALFGQNADEERGLVETEAE